MILVSGTPLDLSLALNDYPANSVQREVLTAMSQSDATYRFDNREQLDFELNLRNEIVNSAKKLNRSGFRFAVFHKSECNEDYWDRTSNGGFRLKSGVLPSAAIQDIFQNGRKYASECATAMVIVYLGALLNLLGEEVFNKLFPSIYLMNWHDLPPLLRDVGIPRQVNDILLGDRCYFKNPQVDPETPELQGENVIVLPGGLYYGHGMGIMTADQIIRILNANRREDATESAYFMENYAARPNFNRLLTASKRAMEASPVSLLWSFPSPVFA